MKSESARGTRAIMVAVAVTALLLGTPAVGQTAFNIRDLAAGEQVATQQFQQKIDNLRVEAQPSHADQLSNVMPWIANTVMIAAGAIMIATGVGAGLGATLIVAGAEGDIMMRDSLSCPVFGGSGTLLAEDSCAWMKVTGQRATLYGLTTDNAGLRMGGQKEIASDWFLGGTLHADKSWMQSGLTASVGQSFDGSVALKHVMGPWLLGGVVALGTGASHSTRPAFTGGTMQGDSTLFMGSTRLRGAYEFAFSGWYARPRLDLDVSYENQPSHQEYGPDPTGLAVGGYQKVSLAISPALEFGGRVDMGSLILRPYVVAGPTFLPNNTRTIDIGFTGLPELGTLQMIAGGPSVLGTVEAGLQLYQAQAWEVKADYVLSVGDSYLSQTIGLRGAYHF